MPDVVVIGGGAAGFFAAIACKESNPALNVLILERGKEVLEKVRISGGGRCNLTHACWTPKELVKYYPRGHKELLGPFHQFAPGDTLDWFAKRGVETKIEEDGRIFPVSDNSQSIVDCLTRTARKLGVEVLCRQNVTDIIAPDEQNPYWRIHTAQQSSRIASKLMLATGSNARIWEILGRLGHTIVSPVPSLFTFDIQSSLLRELPGIAAQEVELSLPESRLSSLGPLLITHWGLSGPATLKLSAWAARELHDKAYHFPLTVNWTGKSQAKVLERLGRLRTELARQSPYTHAQLEIPHRLWKALLQTGEIEEGKRWADLSNSTLQNLAKVLCATHFDVKGKSTFKEEFVTAGGVSLREIDFRSFSSKLYPNLYLAGEVLDIDALTGGFNFQAAWTGGWIAGRSMGNEELRMKNEK